MPKPQTSSYRQVLINDLCEYMRAMQENEMIRHQEICVLIENSNRHYASGVVGEARKRLEDEEGIFFGNVHGKGYRRLPAADAIQECKQQVFCGLKRIRTGVERFVHVRTSELSIEERSSAAVFFQKTANLAGMYRQIEG